MTSFQSGGAICQSHKKTLEVYCWTDKMPLCIECLIANHKTHEVHSIQATLERLRGRLNEASSSLTLFKSQITSKLGSIALVR
jgi:transcriptional/translational regulatory protein YebC/TACO1